MASRSTAGGSALTEKRPRRVPSSTHSTRAGHHTCPVYPSIRDHQRLRHPSRYPHCQRGKAFRFPVSKAFLCLPHGMRFWAHNGICVCLEPAFLQRINTCHHRFARLASCLNRFHLTEGIPGHTNTPSQPPSASFSTFISSPHLLSTSSPSALSPSNLSQPSS